MIFYGTLSAGQDHWDDRGYSGDLTEELLVLGSMFVDSVGWRVLDSGVPIPRYPGQPASASQAREWPRKNATNVYGIQLDDSTVPVQVERATYEAAWYEKQNPGGLNIALRTDQHLARESYGRGDTEFSYFVAGRRPPAAGMAPTATFIPSVMTELAPVLVDGGNPYGITGVVA